MDQEWLQTDGPMCACVATKTAQTQERWSDVTAALKRKVVRGHDADDLILTAAIVRHVHPSTVLSFLSLAGCVARSAHVRGSADWVRRCMCQLVRLPLRLPRVRAAATASARKRRQCVAALSLGSRLLTALADAFLCDPERHEGAMRRLSQAVQLSLAAQRLARGSDTDSSDHVVTDGVATESDGVDDGDNEDDDVIGEAETAGLLAELDGATDDHTVGVTDDHTVSDGDSDGDSDGVDTDDTDGEGDDVDTEDTDEDGDGDATCQCALRHEALLAALMVKMDPQAASVDSTCMSPLTLCALLGDLSVRVAGADSTFFVRCDALWRVLASDLHITLNALCTSSVNTAVFVDILRLLCDIGRKLKGRVALIDTDLVCQKIEEIKSASAKYVLVSTLVDMVPHESRKRRREIGAVATRLLCFRWTLSPEESYLQLGEKRGRAGMDVTSARRAVDGVLRLSLLHADAADAVALLARVVKLVVRFKRRILAKQAKKRRKKKSVDPSDEHADDEDVGFLVFPHARNSVRADESTCDVCV
ncbi:MAG: hypothetical protein MHM6MM_008817, partial [Cercozoa sp. M6MM]